MPLPLFDEPPPRMDLPATYAPPPFSGAVPASRHASYLGAQSAASRAESQAARYLALLDEHGDRGLTDQEAADLMHVDRSSINARRRPLAKRGIVVADGFRKSEHGIKNVVWKLRTEAA